MSPKSSSMSAGMSIGLRARPRVVWVAAGMHAGEDDEGAPAAHGGPVAPGSRAAAGVGLGIEVQGHIQGLRRSPHPGEEVVDAPGRPRDVKAFRRREFGLGSALRSIRMELQGADLTEVDLWDADLRGADLYGVVLTGADLHPMLVDGSRWQHPGAAGAAGTLAPVDARVRVDGDEQPLDGLVAGGAHVRAVADGPAVPPPPWRWRDA